MLQLVMLLVEKLVMETVCVLVLVVVVFRVMVPVTVLAPLALA